MEEEGQFSVCLWSLIFPSSRVRTVSVQYIQGCLKVGIVARLGQPWSGLCSLYTVPRTKALRDIVVQRILVTVLSFFPLLTAF